MNKVFTVNGMKCEHCATKVENTIKELNGVNSAKVNLVNHDVTVDFEEETVKDTDIQNAVNDLGKFELIL